MSNMHYRNLLISIILCFSIFQLGCWGQKATSPSQSLHKSRDSRNSTSLWEVKAPKASRWVAHSGSAVFISRLQFLESYDQHTGKLLWRRDILTILPKTESGSTKNSQVFMTSPAFTANNILLGITYQHSTYVAAVNVSTGSLYWLYSAQPDQSVDTTPHSQPVIANDTLVLRLGTNLIGLHINDGKQQWLVPFDSRLNVPAIPNGCPIVAGSTIFFNSDFGIAYAFNVINGRRLWSTLTDGFKISGSGSVVNVHITYTSTGPILQNDSLIIADGTGITYALSIRDGKVRWKLKTGYVCQFLRAQNKLYASTANGFLEIDPQLGNIIRSFPTHSEVLTCALSGRIAALALAKGGIIVLNLSQWKAVAHIEDVVPIATPIFMKNELIVLGPGNASSDTDETKLRSYQINVPTN